MYGCSLLHTKKKQTIVQVYHQGVEVNLLCIPCIIGTHHIKEASLIQCHSIFVPPIDIGFQTSLTLNAHKQPLTPCSHSCVKHIQWRFLVFGTKKMMTVYEETSNNEHLRKENESKIPNQTNYGRTKLIKQ